MVARDGAEIVYRTVGTGPPVLLANGLGAGWQIWRNQIDQLCGRYRFVTWEYRGLYRSQSAAGASGWDARSLNVHAHDALRVLDAEKIGRVAVVGWSMGAQVALELFDNAPERVASLVLVGGGASTSWRTPLGTGLIKGLVSPLVRTAGKVPRLTETLLRMVVTSPEAFTWARRTGLVGPNLDQELFGDLASRLADLDMAAFPRTFGRYAEHDASALLRKVDVPLLVITGERDPFVSRAALERLVGRIGGAELMVLPGARHYLCVDYPEHVSLRIDKFLREHAYTGAAQSAQHAGRQEAAVPSQQEPPLSAQIA